MMKSEAVDIFCERSRRREPPWVYELEAICANAPTSFLGLAQCAGKARAKLLEPEKRWCRDSDEGVFL